jgi:hypothetical protein
VEPESGRQLAMNLEALSRHNAAIAAGVRSCAPDASLRFVAARDGSLVPALHDGARLTPLHSLYDPMRESRRLHESCGDAGCILFLGLGGGFQVAAALEDPAVCSVLIVEGHRETLRALMERLPLAALLTDERVRLLCGTEEIRQAVLSSWQPALMGGLRTVPLVPWCAHHQDFFNAAARETEAAVEAVRSDYSVQAHFGKRWFSNMLQNMPVAEKQGREIPRRSRASVTAAGPSLEGQMGMLAAGRDGGMLLASDTSLPALLLAGILPDAVLSIDCQIYGYHHFFRGIPESTTLFLDLASPPLLARLTRRTYFVSGGHPFAAYLGARWMEIPRIDMSGGNVTHAAMSLARGLGAREITLYGADFSYPGGRSYCRGTYLHEMFHSRQGRVSPMENSFFTFLFRDPETQRERHAGGLRYTTPVLRGYRDKLLDLMSHLDAECTAAPGDGLSLDHVRAADRGRAAPLHWFPPRCGWRELLRSLADELRDLPALGPSRWTAVSSLRSQERELWNVLLPIAARVEKQSAHMPTAMPAVEEARAWAISRVERALRER